MGVVDGYQRARHARLYEDIHDGCRASPVPCTYSLQASRTDDMLDVARAHQCSIVRRKGNWEFLETPELKQAKQEIRKLNSALDILSKPFPRHETFIPRNVLRWLNHSGCLQQGGRTDTRHQSAYRRFPSSQPA